MIINSKALTIESGTVEALKWLALVLMTLDHVNKYVYADHPNLAFALGRISMPLFAFVFAYNMARPSALLSGAFQRAMKNLTLYGVLATPFFIMGGGLLFGWWPLNIMFMLLAAAVVIYLLETGGRWRWFAAFLVFLLGGAFVEFWHIALLFTVASYYYCKSFSYYALGLMVLSLTSLYFINRNFWALAAIPIILAAPYVRVQWPRVKHLFYVYYPLHLAILVLFFKRV